MNYVVKVEHGFVKIYNADNGAFCRQLSLGNPAVSAHINGDLVTVENEYGQTMIYDAKNGALKRRI